MRENDSVTAFTPFVRAESGRAKAMKLFGEGKTLGEVIAATGLKRATARAYLYEVRGMISGFRTGLVKGSNKHDVDLMRSDE